MLDKSIKRTAPAPCPLSKFFLYRVARYVAFHDGPRIPSEILRELISRVPLSPSEFLRVSPQGLNPFDTLGPSRFVRDRPGGAQVSSF